MFALFVVAFLGFAAGTVVMVASLFTPRFGFGSGKTKRSSFLQWLSISVALLFVGVFAAATGERPSQQAQKAAVTAEPAATTAAVLPEPVPTPPIVAQVAPVPQAPVGSSLLNTPRIERPLIETLGAIQGASNVTVRAAMDGRPAYFVTLPLRRDMTPSGALIVASGGLWGALHAAPVVERSEIAGITVNLVDGDEPAFRFVALADDLAKIDFTQPGDTLEIMKIARVTSDASPGGLAALRSFCTPQRRLWRLCATGL